MAPSPTTSTSGLNAPSREFLVRQATLTALTENYPGTIRLRGRKFVADRMAKLIANEFKEGEDFIYAVRSEFRALAQRWAA